MEIEKEGNEEETVSVEGRSLGCKETESGWADMEFLEGIEFEERDKELDEKMGESRKRKSSGDGDSGRKTGLSGLPGWGRRSNAVKDSDRWKRKVVKVEKDEEGNERRVEAMEKIPLPDGFDLGRETKEMEMNNSGRLKNNFGLNREALFPVNAGMKSEKRNWIASFTKAGCVACRDEHGKLNHKGRDGQPNVLIVGDESIPSTVGYTGSDRNGGKGDSCSWILKVEHLGLEEVSGVLKKINLDKKAADRASGKKEHDFFLANGSKILIASYVHLRKEGLESYIQDFNAMVKSVYGVVGKAEVEVLPVVPVLREGVDEVGRELVFMLREWVDWIGKVSGRDSVRKLSGTGGRVSDQGDGNTFIWKPSFQMKVKDARMPLGKLVEGERTETVAHPAGLTNEIVRARGGSQETEKGLKGDENGAKRTTCEKNGVLLEGEFVFSRAVGEFLREEVRTGTFKGNYVLNLKDQLRMRCMRESEVDKRLKVMIVGASQMGRMGKEMASAHGDKVVLVGRVRMSDEHTDKQHAEMAEEVVRMKEEVDVVVVGGPSNSLLKHGKEGERGFGGERHVRVTKDKDSDDEWDMTYHLTDPVKITMTEKAELVEKMVDMKRSVGEDVRIVHVTMFPRFVEQCCREHMTEEDVWLLDGIRRDMNREVKDMLLESGYDVEVFDWWTLVGARKELTVNEMRRTGMIDNDNVHLTSKSNRVAAASLMCRLLEKKESEGKRRRLE